MSVLGRLEALRDIQRKGSVDYETLNLAISHIESQDERIRELEARVNFAENTVNRLWTIFPLNFTDPKDFIKQWQKKYSKMQDIFKAHFQIYSPDGKNFLKGERE